jgi:hypothetical protein
MLRHEISPASAMDLWYLGVSMMVLAPLAYAKRRLGKRWVAALCKETAPCAALGQLPACSR